MQTQEVCFFRHEALKSQEYVADHELLHFFKLKKCIQLFKTSAFNYDSPREVFNVGRKKYKYFQVLKNKSKS